MGRLKLDSLLAGKERWGGHPRHHLRGLFPSWKIKEKSTRISKVETKEFTFSCFLEYRNIYGRKFDPEIMSACHRAHFLLRSPFYVVLVSGGHVCAQAYLGNIKEFRKYGKRKIILHATTKVIIGSLGFS